MKLNLPDLEGTRILIAGAGGGFDIFGGIALVYAKPDIFKEYFLANYSVRASGDYLYRESLEEDYPEGSISRKAGRPYWEKVYTFPKCGVQLLKKAYEDLIRVHRIDCIILVDGGVDSLMRGDEVCSGTFLEDSISLAAVSQIKGISKYLMCIGFGTEKEENLNHYRVLENIADIIKEGGFVGSCSLTKEMTAYHAYKEACLKAWENKRKSHIHTRIIPSVEGEFGAYQMYEEIDAHVTGAAECDPFVSPLSGIMWFFDVDIVARRNLYVPKLMPTTTFVDARMILRSQMIPQTRSKEVIPL